MTPSVSIKKTDGNLGAASNTDRILAIIATASAGAFDTPFAFTSKDDAEEEFVSGPLMEAAAYCLARGVPVVLIRANPATPGDYGTVDDAGVTGTANVAEGVTIPDGDYDVIVEVLTGGALGTTGIVFRYSMDNGANWSDPQNLGTSLTLTCARGVSFALTSATSTLVAGDTWSVVTTGPRIGNTDLNDSFNALKNYDGEWLRALVVAECDATMFASCNSFAESFHAEGKYPEVVANTRPRGVAESRPTYQAALAAIAAGVQSAEVSPCADHVEVVSEVNGWRLRMALAIPYAARLMIIDDSQDASAQSDGALDGVFVVTRDGDKRYHDERRFPGLDVLGYTTARTFGGRPIQPGVYINNPRLLSGAGSDFRYFQHSAILNRAIEKTFTLLQPRLSQGGLADPDTGRIREDVAKSMEEAITAELRTEFQDPGRCSAIKMVLSRTDDVLSTDTLHFDVQQIPLFYIKKFIGKAGLVKRLTI